MSRQQPAVTSIGLVGLGNAGLSLAAPLLRRFPVVGFDLEPERIAAGRSVGLQAASSIEEVARRCELVVLSLPSPAASRGAVDAMPVEALRGRLIIETSTVGPHDVEAVAVHAAAHGADVIDAAIVGGVAKLAQGKTTFLVGASDGAYARAQPVLQAASERVFHLGPAGSGMRAKLVNNAVAHTCMVMLVEAAALAAKAGVPMDVFYELMSSESGLMRPLTHRFGERILAQDFAGGMSVANARKDSALALDLARELGVPLFTMQASHTVYEIASRDDLKQLDYAAISRLWERWAGVSFSEPGAS